MGILIRSLFRQPVFDHEFDQEHFNVKLRASYGDKTGARNVTVKESTLRYKTLMDVMQNAVAKGDVICKAKVRFAFFASPGIPSGSTSQMLPNLLTAGLQASLSSRLECLPLSR